MTAGSFSPVENVTSERRLIFRKGKYTMRSRRSSIAHKARVILAILIALFSFSLLFHSPVGDTSKLVSYERNVPGAFHGLQIMNEGTRFRPRSFDGDNATKDEQRHLPAEHQIREQARYAYAFVIGGCMPEKPSYRYFIYNMLITARILREAGSRADIVAFFQMSYKSEHERLLDEDVRQLRAMNIKIKYIPKSPQECFYRTVLDKFRILGLVEYRRVLFMDGDVIPTRNLDFLFEMSDGEDATLKENLVVAGKLEPANAGFFMLAPKKGALEEINSIIQEQEVKARSLPYPYFDPVEGWGHVIAPTDPWHTITKLQGTDWSFWSAFADQGLLYYWTRYVKQDVSILNRDMVMNWGGGQREEKKLSSPFRNVISDTPCWSFEKGNCTTYANMFYHFTSGKKKPWMVGPPEGFSDADKQWQSPWYLWFYQLDQVNKELNMNLNFQNWTQGKRKQRRQSLGLSSMSYTVQNASTNLLEEMTE